MGGGGEKCKCKEMVGINNFAEKFIAAVTPFHCECHAIQKHWWWYLNISKQGKAR